MPDFRAPHPGQQEQLYHSNMIRREMSKKGGFIARVSERNAEHYRSPSPASSLPSRLRLAPGFSLPAQTHFPSQHQCFWGYKPNQGPVNYNPGAKPSLLPVFVQPTR